MESKRTWTCSKCNLLNNVKNKKCIACFSTFQVNHNNNLTNKSNKLPSRYKRFQPSKIAIAYEPPCIDNQRKDPGSDQYQSEKDNIVNSYNQIQPIKHSFNNNNNNSVHILVVYKNTSICLKFTTFDMDIINNHNLPIIINMNLQKLQKSINTALISIQLTIPDALIILISQYIFPQRECKCKTTHNGQKKDVSLTIFDNINNFGKIFGTYCLSGKYGHELIKKYEDIVLKIGDICNDYASMLLSRQLLTTHTLFDDYIFQNLKYWNSTFTFHLCRYHYAMKKK